MARVERTEFYAMDSVTPKAAEQYRSLEDEGGNVTGLKKNIYSYPSIGSADADALTTAGDLDLFMQTLKHGDLLSSEMTEAILSPKETYRI